MALKMYYVLQDKTKRGQDKPPFLVPGVLRASRGSDPQERPPKHQKRWPCPAGSWPPHENLKNDTNSTLHCEGCTSTDSTSYRGNDYADNLQPVNSNLSHIFLY